MKVIYKKLPSKKVDCVATIGVFDGVHLGHRFILKEVKKKATELKLPSLVITFDSLPQHFLHKHGLRIGIKPIRPYQGYIIDRSEKISRIGELGIDYLWLLKSTKGLLSLTAKEFIDYLDNYFNIKHLVIGQDFRFGCQRRGDYAYLKNISKRCDFRLSLVKKKSKNKQAISSSLIRNLIKQGDIVKANQLLGRNFTLKGKVCKGRGLGKKLGFPTANVVISDYVVPGNGVYAAYVCIKKKLYLSAVNIGYRPTFLEKKTKKKAVEAHIINFQNNVLGEIIKIIFLKRIRNENKFSSSDQLSQSIKKDINYLTATYCVPPRNCTQLIDL